MSLLNLKNIIAQKNASLNNSQNTQNVARPEKSGGPPENLAHKLSGQAARTKKPTKWKMVVTEKSDNTNAPPGENEATEKLFRLQSSEPACRKIVRAAAKIADQLTDDDRRSFARVLRRCLRARHQPSWDIEKKKMVSKPDYRTQLAAVTLGLAYTEGPPTQKVAVAHAQVPTSEMLERYRESPAMLEALRAASGLGAAVEIEGQVIDLEEMTPNEGVQ